MVMIVKANQMRWGMLLPGPAKEEPVSLTMAADKAFSGANDSLVKTLTSSPIAVIHFVRRLMSIKC